MCRPKREAKDLWLSVDLYLVFELPAKAVGPPVWLDVQSVTVPNVASVYFCPSAILAARARSSIAAS